MATYVINCADCGVRVESRATNRKRCDPCGVSVEKERNRKRNEAVTAAGGWAADTLRRKYGWTVDDFQTQLEAQGGACAICRDTVPGGHNYWHVDHDHSTGKVRGILCHNCNLGVGNAADDPKRLRAMARYLRAHAGG